MSGSSTERRPARPLPGYWWGWRSSACFPGFGYDPMELQNEQQQINKNNRKGNAKKNEGRQHATPSGTFPRDRPNWLINLDRRSCLPLLYQITMNHWFLSCHRFFSTAFYYFCLFVIIRACASLFLIRHRVVAPFLGYMFLFRWTDVSMSGCLFCAVTDPLD